MPKIRLLPGLFPIPVGLLTALPDSLAGFEGVGEERRGRRKYKQNINNEKSKKNIAQNKSLVALWS